MEEIVIGVIILIVFVVVFLSGRKQKLAHAESTRTARRAERESWARKSVLSYAQVQQFREELIKSVEDKLADHPEQVDRMKEIINDWADLRIQSFKERRSWIRRPGQVKQE